MTSQPTTQVTTRLTDQQWLDRFGTAAPARSVTGNPTVGVDHEVFEDTYIDAGWEKHYDEAEVTEVKEHIVASLLGEEDPTSQDVPNNPLPLLNTVVIERGTEQPSAGKPQRRILHGGIVVAAVRDFRAGTLTVPANLLPDYIGFFADESQRVSYEDIARHGVDIALLLAVYEI